MKAEGDALAPPSCLPVLLPQPCYSGQPTTQLWGTAASLALGRALVQVSVQEIVEDNLKHNSKIMTFELSNSHHPETTGYLSKLLIG